MISMKVNHFSNVLSMNMDCYVLLPAEVLLEEKLKVLWLYHGSSGDEMEWLYYGSDEKNICRNSDDFDFYFKFCCFSTG